MLPTTAELPVGWKLSGSNSVGWRDGDTSEEFAKYLPCSATAQESAERHGYGSVVVDSPGNGGEGIDLRLSVPRSPDTYDDGPAPKAEAVTLVEENLTLYRKMYDCYTPKSASIGDSSIVFTTERFTHIIMRVGPVEVAINGVPDGRPTAEEWARVMAERVRAVLDGKKPTARVD
ncbi:hypothetical protein ACFC4G_46470 [Streptomyces sp. NPDC056002]|uniref:hypothetical protein n=1 Tax=Streptomyces sp. NPDC056002 TaxID=3345675 RepID=UPI0035DBAB8D